MTLKLLLKTLPIKMALDLEITKNQGMRSKHCFGHFSTQSEPVDNAYMRFSNTIYFLEFLDHYLLFLEAGTWFINACTRF